MPASAATLGFIQPRRQEHVLLWCVLASIALHVLVLLGVSPDFAPAPPTKSLLVLTARLAPVATAPREPPAQAQPVPPPPKPVPPPKKPVPPPPKPVPPPKKLLLRPPKKLAPAPRPVPKIPAARPAPAPQKKAPPVTEKTTPPEAAPAAPATEVSSVPPAAASTDSAATPLAAVSKQASAKFGSEADRGTLERYRLALIAATKRYKRYPAIAMEKGWQGRVVVHMAIGANGMLASATIKTSSGHPILDKQAVSMLKKGKTTVRIPAGLRGREFGVDVPVIFNLDDPRS